MNMHMVSYINNSLLFHEIQVDFVNERFNALQHRLPHGLEVKISHPFSPSKP